MSNLTDNKQLEKYIYEISLNEQTSLELLYNETRTYVYRYAFSLVKNSSDAEDIMQDTYVNINKYASMYSPRNKPLAWILRITKNLCLNHIKKTKRITNETDLENKVYSNKDSIHNSVLLKTIIEELSDEERQIFMLNSIDNFKFREIATLLNLNLSTVLSKYNRAIKKVRQKYKDGEL